MAFRTSWMVKGRFSRCLLWAWLKTRGRRSILAWVSGSSVSWVGVCCRRKLSWVAWSTVAGSLVREPSSCPDRGDGAVAGIGHGVVEVADGLVGEFVLRIPFVFLGRCAVACGCATAAGPP